MPNYEQNPDYDSLVETLAEKTKSDKLRWSETANENVFIASVKGEQTFEVFSLPDSDWVHLTVRDQEGKELYSHQMLASGAASQLFSLAKRIATRVDEKIEKTLELLEQL